MLNKMFRMIWIWGDYDGDVKFLSIRRRSTKGSGNMATRTCILEEESCIAVAGYPIVILPDVLWLPKSVRVSLQALAGCYKV
jgi:hypothetical protein